MKGLIRFVLFLAFLLLLVNARIDVEAGFNSDYFGDRNEDLNGLVDAERIRQNLRDYTSEPHVAGTAGNKRVAEKIAAKWKSFGLENVHFDTYRVLLSYPNYSDPNHVRLFDSNGERIFESSGVSPTIIPAEQGAPQAGVQWVAFAGNGTVRAPLVYVNYARPEDMDTLERAGIELKDRIALIRYGRMFRGDKIRQVQRRGALGAILYSDPADCAVEGTTADKVYPNTDYMPPHGTQRGTLKSTNGDALTPFFPARKDLYSKMTVKDAKKSGDIPSIPVLPLSYGDAYELLSRMCGAAVPKEWQGGLNITYKYGPCMERNETVEVDVKSRMEMRTVQNVIGYIPGRVEPDRYVMLGNHFDAWVYGAMDPNSGTAVLSEVARVLAVAAKSGVWTPRRTVIFCNWDAEEHGLIGSGEFVEGHAQQLSKRAVAYLNVDTITGNQTLDASTVPSLYDAVVEAAKRVPNPVKAEVAEGRKTVYDSWIKYRPGDVHDRPNYPKMTVPGGGSDHERFLSFAGVPVADFRYARRDEDTAGYPLYHTLYETPFVNEHIFDWDGMSVHAAVARYWVQLARILAEPPLLPLNSSIFAHRFLEMYARELKAAFAETEKAIGDMGPATEQLSHLVRNIQEFVRRAEAHQAKILSDFAHLRTSDRSNAGDELRLRAANDRLMEVDRCFVGPTPVPGSPLKRNILFSTSDLDSYSSSVMPGIYDQLFKLKSPKLTANEQQETIKDLAVQVSAIQFAIKCATMSLSEMLY